MTGRGGGFMAGIGRSSLGHASLQQSGLQQISLQQAAAVTLVLATCLSTAALAETKKEYRFEVGVKPKVSIINQFGSVTVRPTTGNYVLVNATIYSDKVEVDHSQNGNRVDVQSHLLPFWL